MIVKPSILPGTMELLPQEQLIFNKMKDIIRETYELFSFLPIDTPSMEKREILLAKGGGETEKQIYNIENTSTETSLRFDLTVPLARYVSMHEHELKFPFKRYQIDKVYRGERNQKGRYREFYQCDVDIIGDDTLSKFYDAELVKIISIIFKKFGFDKFTIMINNRNIMNGFLRSLGVEDTVAAVRALDKYDKIGRESLEELLLDQGINSDAVKKILALIEFEGTNDETIKYLEGLNIDNEIFLKGLSEMKEVLSNIKLFKVGENNYKFTLKLQRGLDYYTSTVIETTLDDYKELGSVAGGGSYENLTQFYSKRNLPGVGISIGLTRLFFQLSEKNILPKFEKDKKSVLIAPLDIDMAYSIDILNELHALNVHSEVLYSKMKMKKIFDFAETNDFDYIIFIGQEELEKKVLSVRDLANKESLSLSLDELKKLIQ
ncbi:histidine--tRNA ligase [Fenollaria sporofastidiosus]|uniref:histidine--tRNA ligase n=1 Tax=Fenollaria sporofastidiosus TaxID=2811778 RepID=UPI001BFFF3EF|nr:histidine--tRNA ligase [Fenollaria sporofastidiosus]